MISRGHLLSEPQALIENDPLQRRMACIAFIVRRKNIEMSEERLLPFFGQVQKLRLSEVDFKTFPDKIHPV